MNCQHDAMHISSKLPVLHQFNKNCIAAFFTLGLAVTTFANGEDPSDQVSADLHAIQPFVGETTCLIVKFDANRIELPQGTDALGTTPQAKAAVTEATRQAADTLAKLQTLASDQPFYLTAGIPISHTRVPVYVFQRKTSAAAADRLVEFANRLPQLEAQVRGDYVVAVRKEGSDDYPTTAPTATLDAIKMAAKAVAKYPAYAIIVPPQYVWRTVRELSPELPRQLGGGPSSVLTDGVQWVAIGLDLKTQQIEVVIQSANEQAAHEFAAHLPVMLRSAYEAATHMHEQIPPDLAKRVIQWLKPGVDGTQVKIHIDGGEESGRSVELLAAIVQRIEESTRRYSNQRKFKQIMFGLRNYHSAHRSFPPAAKQGGDGGTHRLSWRVHILPFVEQQALHNQFHLDEPWDSPHNKTLIAKMPDIYASNSFANKPPEPGHTTFLAPVGERTIFGGKATRLHEVTDGTSGTIALVETERERAVVWTAPNDFAFDPKNPLGGILIGTDGNWLAAFADGSVRQLSAVLDPKSVLHLFQMNDGNVVHLD